MNTLSSENDLVFVVTWHSHSTDPSPLAPPLFDVVAAHSPRPRLCPPVTRQLLNGCPTAAAAELLRSTLLVYVDVDSTAAAAAATAAASADCCAA
jgi:hypothetical protein